jgi:N-acetylneuraminate synthase
MLKKIRIIAEAGVNHNGDINIAKELIRAASDAGADVVKFQTFKAELLVSKIAKKANYQINADPSSDNSQLSMLKKLELKKEEYIELRDYSQKLNIEFMSTAFDSESLNFLVSELGLKVLKIPSGEITNSPFILEHARSKCNLIISTGMASLEEVENCLRIVAYGFLNDKGFPSESDLLTCLDEAKDLLRERVTLLHCTTEYPAPIKDVNLNAINTLNKEFGIPSGYSDHTEGINISIAAAAKGACLIEKHFTLDRDMKGPDHKASLEPHDLKDMIDAIRVIEIALGDGIKISQESENINKIAARKSIVAIKDINKTESFNQDNIGIKRPGNGIAPAKYWDYLGKKSQKIYHEGDLIDE